MRAALWIVMLGLAPLAGAQEPAPPTYPVTMWTFDTTSISFGSGAVADLDGDGKPEIVVGTYFNDEHVYCFNAEDGSLAWKVKSDRGPFDASIAIADVNGDGKLEALFSDSSSGGTWCVNGAGETVWKVRLPNSTDSPPAIADLDGDGTVEVVIGTMMLGDRNGRVVAMAGTDGHTLWTAKVPGHVQSEPVLVDVNGDGVLDALVTNWFGDNRVRALNGKDGAELWQHELADKTYHGVSVLPTDDGPRLVAASTKADIRLLALDGTELWKKEIGGYLFAPITIANLDGEGAPEIVCVANHVTVLDATGAQQWQSAPFGTSERGVAVADIDGDGDLDLALGAAKTFRVLDGKTGTELWKFDATCGPNPVERIGSAPLIADFDGDGKLDVFFLCGFGSSGKNRADGYGRAYALRAGAGTAATGGTWTTFRGNLRRTGARTP